MEQGFYRLYGIALTFFRISLPSLRVTVVRMDVDPVTEVNPVHAKTIFEKKWAVG